MLKMAGVEDITIVEDDPSSLSHVDKMYLILDQGLRMLGEKPNLRKDKEFTDLTKD